MVVISAGSVPVAAETAGFCPVASFPHGHENGGEGDGSMWTPLEMDAALRRAAVVLLPADVFADLDGTRGLALIDDALPRHAERTDPQ